MTGAILYLGDTHLHNAAAYLAGLMHLWNWQFDYIPSEQPLGETELRDARPLYIVSDYAAANISDALQRQLLDDVAGGAGLVMIGGWESFHGQGGNWDGTPVGEVLPVHISTRDDRVNSDRPVVVVPVGDHPTLAGLPWDSRPPVIGGYNRVQAKTNANVVLEARPHAVSRHGDELVFRSAGADPLLVFDSHGAGATAALMTDVAPHWVGPLVDWGDERVAACAPGAGDVEVGDLYARLLRQVLTFLMRN